MRIRARWDGDDAGHSDALKAGVFGGVVIGTVTCALHHPFNNCAASVHGILWRLALLSIISSLAAILVGAL